MASVLMMAAGTIRNAAAFTGGNSLAKYSSDDGRKAALDENKWHDKALEDYQAVQNKYMQEYTKPLVWIETIHKIKVQANQNLKNTDYTFKLYNQVHPDQQITTPTEPQFSHFYQPSKKQTQNKLLFVGGRALTLAYAAFHFLCKVKLWIPIEG